MTPLIPNQSAGTAVDEDVDLQNNVSHKEELPSPSELFVDPMMGAPLSIYVHEEVEGRDNLVVEIKRHGGFVGLTYSTVPYVLVDPKKESGQSLYRSYANKKGKVVLDAQWAYECIRQNTLLTFKDDWANCKVKGTERNEVEVVEAPSGDMEDHSAEVNVASTSKSTKPKRAKTKGKTQPTLASIKPAPQPAYNEHAHPQGSPTINRWQSMSPTAPHPYALPPGWEAGAPDDDGNVQPPQTYVMPAWVDDHGRPYMYYSQEPYQYIMQPPDSADPYEAPPTEPADDEPARGRKRKRSPHPDNVTDASTLIHPLAPPRRSPTPPARAMTSIHGGNMYTVEDVTYLKKYIDYCRDMGWMLSLREICERLAVKAPHHSFYSWRRYCNKHQIRLGAYSMEQQVPSMMNLQHTAADAQGEGPSAHLDREDGLHQGPQEEEDEMEGAYGGEPPLDGLMSHAGIPDDGGIGEEPVPPKVLYRSTTGKGIAFTREDVDFLVRFLNFRQVQTGGPINMVQFWKDVAEKAPHHSRASWMKYWRRHRHELEDNTDSPPVASHPPPKRARYSRDDDVMLARFFATRPVGIQDSVFRTFATQNPHHPWKGWQEHYRLHKAEIDYMIQQLERGEDIGGPAPIIHDHEMGVVHEGE